MLEPSAGNGLLTIYYPERLVTVNDLDPVRYEHLRSQPFRWVDHRDASVPFPPAFQRAFDAVLTNPPFGSLPDVNRDFGFPFKALDHVMVAHAPACLRDGEILTYDDHQFAIACCIATLIQEARDRGVAVEPLIRAFLGADPESGLTPAQLYDACIATSDAWAQVSARLREAWQSVTPQEMREHYRVSMAEGLAQLPEVDGLPFGDEEFECMVWRWVERLGEG